MDKEMIKQMEQFQKDFPDATPKDKRDFLEFLSLCSVFEITEDDPFGILKDDGKFGILNNEYEQSKFIAKLNDKKHFETDADRIVKDLLYRCALEKLAEQGVDIPDITDEWNEENEAYRQWCNKAHTSPKTANKPQGTVESDDDIYDIWE